MTSVINGVTFFTDDLVASMSHKRETFKFTEENERILKEHRIYTEPRNKTNIQRFKRNDAFQVGVNSIVEPYSMVFQGNWFTSIGAFSSTNSALPANSVVGRYSSIAHNVVRMYGNHPVDRFTTSMLTYDSKVTAFNDYLTDNNASVDFVKNPIQNSCPIVIGNDVWVGQDVRFVSTGVTVGDGAIIAGGSLVTKDVPPYAVVGGVPAKVIKYRFPEKDIEKLMELKWWQYGFADFDTIKLDDPIDVFIEKIEEKVANNELKPFKPKVLTYKDLV